MCAVCNVLGNWLSWHMLKPHQDVKIPLWWRFSLFGGSLLFLIFLALWCWTLLYKGYKWSFGRERERVVLIKNYNQACQMTELSTKPLSQVGAINSNEIWAYPNWISFFSFWEVLSFRNPSRSFAKCFAPTKW